jgi:hypothetical protein
MRVPLALVALTLAVPAMAGTSNAQRPANCPKTTTYPAGRGAVDRSSGLRPRKLTELPPARAYMAVYRQLSGCEMPLTMVDYRNPPRR